MFTTSENFKCICYQTLGQYRCSTRKLFEIVHTQNSGPVTATVKNDGPMVLSITCHVDKNAQTDNLYCSVNWEFTEEQFIGANGVTHIS